jgi:rhodanese-related sulfurtransferase/predicted transcriptional regulator
MNQKRPQKEKLYQLFSQIAAALANPHRLELLDLLVQAPRTVEELAQEAHMSVANTSQHLQKLKQAKLVTDERAGTYIWYRLADPAVAHLWLKLRQVAEKQLTEVEQALEAYRHNRHQFTPISAEELHLRLSQHELVLLDVRPAVEYQAGHLPQAVSIPLSELEQRLQELPTNQTIVAYCRGPYCVYADEALELLQQHGRAVARFDLGVAEWQAAGYTLER